MKATSFPFFVSKTMYIGLLLKAYGRKFNPHWRFPTSRGLLEVLETDNIGSKQCCRSMNDHASEQRFPHSRPGAERFAICENCLQATPYWHAYGSDLFGIVLRPGAAHCTESVPSPEHDVSPLLTPHLRRMRSLGS